MDIYKRGDVPEFNQEFPVDPFELGADLVEFASDGQELQSVELEDYKAASERIPLRKNNRYLVQEEAAMKASPSETAQLHSADLSSHYHLQDIPQRPFRGLSAAFLHLRIDQTSVMSLLVRTDGTCCGPLL